MKEVTVQQLGQYYVLMWNLEFDGSLSGDNVYSPTEILN